jgi:hypothetical protein
MTNTSVISRKHVIFGLCLPLAILLGYLLAEPLESSSLAIVTMVICVLLLPLMLRWYHPLLIVSWNATLFLGFLPGRPHLWILLAFVGLLMAVLGRAVSPDRKFLLAPKVTWSLGCFIAVVIVTGCLTGGFGLEMLGSDRVGGKGYFFMLAAVAGYCALTSQPIPLQRARLLVGVYFLSGLTAAVGHLIYHAPGLYFLYFCFEPIGVLSQAEADYAVGDYASRLGGMSIAGVAANAFLLSRYGLAGMLDLTRPWRLALLLGAGFVSMYGGFRSAVLLQVLLFAVLFTVEGLWRTRYLLIALCSALTIGGVLAVFADKLPPAVQRAVSFLPIKVDPWVKMAAESSTEWRMEMWRTLLPELPKYLFKGKGYALDSQELSMVTDLSRSGTSADSAAAALFAGNYHNGPLSVLIPFGVYGTVAFLWFLAAGGWVLRQNHRHGHPALHTINAFLLAYYVTRIIFFFFIFGALSLDLFHFTGLVGLSIALNTGVSRPNQQTKPTAG